MNADTPQGSAMQPEPSSTPSVGPEAAEDEATTILPATNNENTTVLPAHAEDDTRALENTDTDETSILDADADQTQLMAVQEDDPRPSPEISEPMSEPSETMGESSGSEHEDSPLSGESDRPAFSPTATGEVPPYALRRDESPHDPTADVDAVPREAASVPHPMSESSRTAKQSNWQAGQNQPAQSMSEPSEDTSQSGVKFGLLTWGLLLIIAGVSIWLLPWMGQVNWNLVAVLVFGALGVILLLVAALASFSNRRRANRR